MSNSKLRKKFVFLKQILEEATSDKSTDSAREICHSEEETAKRIVSKSAGSSAGPAGRYPVKFGVPRCKSKSCQTKLSSFPLFPVPEDIMWISDGEGRSNERRVPRAKKKKKQSKSKDDKKSAERGPSEKDGELTRSLNSRSPVRLNPGAGTRADFRSEHQLRDSSNPAILAWVHRKNIHARKKRREERRERRAKRLVLEEESRLKSERVIESEVKVKEWFKIKRRHTWRSNRSKVSPQTGTVASNTDKASPPPPPGYTVVKSFKCSENKEFPLNEQNEQDPYSTLASQSNYTKTASVKPEEKDLGGSKRPKSSVPVPPRPNTSTARPKTARERMSKQSVKVNNENQSPSKMQSMSYDEWLKNKREEDRKQKTQKEREFIDSHLEAVIAELGKQRVERILSPRKRVDTGLKNSKRSPEPSQSTSSKGGHKTARYKWVSTKKPRPEPQGCDCPDSGQDDGDGSIVVLQNPKVPETASERACRTEDKSVDDKTLEFCQEVDKKCEQLKPSMDKMLSILDAEIKKQKGRTKKRKDQCNTDDKHSMEAQRGSEVDALNQGNPLGNCHHSETSSRPKSAKPGHGTVTAEQAKKIKSDMDILGLCSSSSDEAVADSAEKSTVRDNYFDYGSDVDPKSMKPAKYAPAPAP